jgi:hypothetical protein
MSLTSLSIGAAVASRASPPRQSTDEEQTTPGILAGTHCAIGRGRNDATAERHWQRAIFRARGAPVDMTTRLDDSSSTPSSPAVLHVVVHVLRFSSCVR